MELDVLGIFFLAWKWNKSVQCLVYKKASENDDRQICAFGLRATLTVLTLRVCLRGQRKEATI